MALSDLPDVLGMEERGASSNSGGVSVESYKEIFSKGGCVDQQLSELWTQSMCSSDDYSGLTGHGLP